jgi:hypothetical protein
MFKCHLLDGRFEDVEIADLSPVLEILEARRKELHAFSIEDIIDILDQLGKEIVKDPELSRMEGASYISLWLRRSNLERLCALNYGRREQVDRFTEVRPGLQMRAQPRGTSCHWLPNNVASLSVFSLMLAVLSKNAALLKVSEINRPILTAVLSKLSGDSGEKDGRSMAGDTIARAVSMISFDSSRVDAGTMMSLAADVRVVWGGSEAVRGVSSLPHKDTCDTLIFGPKYSLAVFDQAFLARDDLDRVLRQLAMDIVLFDQTACSSPQVVLLERGDVTAWQFAERLAEVLKGLPRRLLDTERPEARCLDIINARGEYLLSTDKNIIMPKDLSWTVLIDHEDGLPEPVHGRCIFVREVEDLNNAARQMTRSVQTIALCVQDEDSRRDFVERASYAGADRFVLPGEMNDFTLPWDGLLPLSRMVRWTTIRRDSDAQ